MTGTDEIQAHWNSIKSEEHLQWAGIYLSGIIGTPPATNQTTHKTDLVFNDLYCCLSTPYFDTNVVL